MQCWDIFELDLFHIYTIFQFIDAIINNDRCPMLVSSIGQGVKNTANILVLFKLFIGSLHQPVLVLLLPYLV